MKESKKEATTLEQALAISAKELAEKLSLSPRTIWRLVSSGRLPKMVSIGGSSKRFLMADVNLFLECGCDIRRFEVMKEAQK